jgi:hypothetical protein
MEEKWEGYVFPTEEVEFMLFSMKACKWVGLDEAI